MNQKNEEQIFQDYDTTQGIIFVVELDGYYTQEQAEVIQKKLQENGFISHIAEV